jgi:hypothetical protein
MKKEAPRYVTLLLLLAALGLCVYGAAVGQTRDVLTKAATICMECIGLG